MTPCGPASGKPGERRTRALLRLFLWGVVTFAPAAVALDFRVETAAGGKYTVVRVDPRRDHLRLFLRDEAGQPFSGFPRLEAWLAARHQPLRFAMNAGMFQRDLSPVGLFIAEGVEVHRLNRASASGNFYLKPNGVFLVTPGGARVVETSTFPAVHERVLLATQSGPLLVEHGRIHPAFNPRSESRHIRNGVGVTPLGEAVFAISSQAVTFFEFASLFRDRLGCPDALYLDGSVSSLYAPPLGREDGFVPIGPILGVVD